MLFIQGQEKVGRTYARAIIGQKQKIPSRVMVSIENSSLFRMICNVSEFLQTRRMMRPVRTCRSIFRFSGVPQRLLTLTLHHQNRKHSEHGQACNPISRLPIEYQHLLVEHLGTPTLAILTDYNTYQVDSFEPGWDPLIRSWSNINYLDDQMKVPKKSDVTYN